MDSKRLVLLATICFICFLSLFIRPDLFGFDSYASLECAEGNCSFLSRQPLAVVLFSVMPVSLLFFKVVMFLCLFASVVAVFLLVEHFFDERLAWLSIFVGLGTVPVWLFTMGQFENDIFAIPLIFFGFLCFFKKERLIGAGLLLLSTFFWLWPGYLTIVPGYNALEGQLFSGLSLLFIGLFFLPFCFFIKSKLLKLFLIVFLFLGLWSGKLTVLLVPFVVLGIAQLLYILEEKGKSISFVLYIAFFMLIGLNIAFLMQQPTFNDWENVGDVIKLSKDTNYPIYNDWSYGYWLRNKGYDTNYCSGGKELDYNSFKKPFIAFTQQELDCNEFKRSVTATRQTIIWICD